MRVISVIVVFLFSTASWADDFKIVPATEGDWPAAKEWKVERVPDAAWSSSSQVPELKAPHRERGSEGSRFSTMPKTDSPLTAAKSETATRPNDKLSDWKSMPTMQIVHGGWQSHNSKENFGGWRRESGPPPLLISEFNEIDLPEYIPEAQSTSRASEDIKIR